MTKKERYTYVLDYFKNNVPNAETELTYSNPYELIVAVVLSAQCTDKRVNMVTPALFKKYPEPKSLSRATVEDVFSLIKSISYPNNKAKHLVGLGQLLMSNFKGIVPSKVEDLVLLPGVGRKTANVVASVVFNQPKMAVDTHVFRVSARIGLTTNSTTPLETEKQLVKNIPEELIHIAHHWLILHGRYVCTAKNPKCNICELKSACKSFKKLSKASSH
ncbi:MAG: endonuclease III [Bacteroidota bacterium]|jgi:endonuclease-3